ncbi:MAG: amidase [Myxococcales bacterium]|nr:amidase [Myxococcales bacterium]
MGSLPVAEFATLDAVAQAELVRNGEVSPKELIDVSIARVEAHDAALNAVVIRQFDRARGQAVSAELPDGPFRGVPMLLKDIGAYLDGDPHYAGMALLKRVDWREQGESTFAGRLRRAGFVSIGRTNTPELALSVTTEPESFGATHNPWNLAHSPGGSSGGAGAAVAAGYVAVGHSSDGGGSIRIPASHCGLIGLKPTRGRCSFGPSIGERWGGFSNEGFVTRSVRDTAALLDVVSGDATGDPYSAPPLPRPLSAEVGADPGKLRVGVMRALPGRRELHADALAAVDTAAKLLEDLGHHVEESHPKALDDPDAGKGFVVVVTSSVAAALESWSEKTGELFGPKSVEPLTWAVAEIGRTHTAAQYIEAVTFNHAHSRRVAAWWDEGYDLLLTPTSGEPPPELGEFEPTTDNPLQGFVRAMPFSAFTSPFNVTGQPAVSLPVHWNAAGLPLGAQLVAARGREDLLVRVAAQVEDTGCWQGRRPPLSDS